MAQGALADIRMGQVRIPGEQEFLQGHPIGGHEVLVTDGSLTLPGSLSVLAAAQGIVLLAYGSRRRRIAS